MKTPGELAVTCADVITKAHNNDTVTPVHAIVACVCIYHAAYTELYKEWLVLVDDRVTDKYIIRKLREHIRRKHV